jgi:hypothetical protein
MLEQIKKKIVWLGLDPGNTAGVAVLLPDGEFQLCQQVPHLVQKTEEEPVKRRGGKKKKKVPIKKRPDLQQFVLIVRRAQMKASSLGCTLKACVEDVGAMPTDARATAFTFGCAVGSFLGVLTAMNVPIIRVRPAVWKKYLGLARVQGMSDVEFKNLSRDKIKELAGLDVKSDAAEAALLAYYAMKTDE